PIAAATSATRGGSSNERCEPSGSRIEIISVLQAKKKCGRAALFQTQGRTRLPVTDLLYAFAVS
ncbi:MAG TPA: hypothetical protein VF014_02240, partial [Casimicrobiaceae bacterium]|nr:hypothetical protein [Casimicrobiaceae bacterium]